ncbi:MAG: FliH/SctL family protein [Pseudomonadota bacterium]
MKQAVKFIFDTRFDNGSEPASKSSAKAASVFSKEEIERARAEGYASGFIEGETRARAQSDAEVAQAMEHFAANAGSLLAALQAESAVIRGEAASLALVAVRKLAPALVATRPQAEIEAVLRDCLTHLNREPHIVLRVSENLVEQLKSVVDRMAMERGLAGRIILLGQNDVAEGDCIVEWADGGVVRSRADIEAELNEIVERYIATLSAPKADFNRLAIPEAR